MNAELLADFMLRRGTLTPAALERARRRQHLYGGAFDTILLELGLADEAAIANALAKVTGLDLPPAAWLEAPAPEATALADLATARRLWAIPVALAEERVRLVVRPGARVDAVAVWAAERDRGAECYIVLEARFEAMLAAVYAAPLSPRFISLVGRLVGRERARRLTSAHVLPHAITAPPVDTGPVVRPLPAAPPAPELDIEIVEAEEPASDGPAAPDVPDPAPAVAPEAEDAGALLAELAVRAPDDEPGRAAVLVALRRHRADPRVRAAMAAWRRQVAGEGATGRRAIDALLALRDKHAVPVLAQRLGSADSALAQAAHAALVTITGHDLGRGAGRWARFWRERRGQHRAEWLIDALASKSPELRLAAARGLEELGGGYVGYHYDLDKREREEARRRWADWWDRTGRALHAADDETNDPDDRG